MTNPPRCNVFCCQMKKPYLIPLVYKIEVTSDKSKRFIHTIGHPKIWAFINDILVLLYSNWCLFFRAEFFYKINNSQKILVHITPSFYNCLSHIRFYFITNRIITQEKRELLSKFPLAGPQGFEPWNDGVRVRCLTIWRWANVLSQQKILYTCGYIVSSIFLF